jgi:hypothetical protein
MTESANATLQDAIAKHYEAELSSLLARCDYDGAAALKRDKESGRLGTAVICAATSKPTTDVLTSRLHEEVMRKAALKDAEDEMEYIAKLASLLESEDYEGAAALQKENEARCIASRVQAHQAMTESANATLQDEIAKHYESELMSLLARFDYDGAAALKRDKESGRLGTAVSSAVPSKPTTDEPTSSLHHEEALRKAALKDAEDEKYYRAKLASLLASEDFNGASAWKKNREYQRLAAGQISAAVNQGAVIQDATLPVLNHGVGHCTLKELQTATKAIPSVVNLTHVRFLAMGKETPIEFPKGEMKGIDKDKSKKKGSGKGCNKGDASIKGKVYGSYTAAKGSSKRTSAAKALYFGQDGYVQCIIVGSGHFLSFTDDTKGHDFNLQGLRYEARSGLLFLSGECQSEKCAHALPFEHCLDYTASVHSVDSMTTGDFVSVAISVQRVTTDLWTQGGDPYIEIDGLDMEQNMLTRLKLWRYDEADNIVSNKFYIIHGLKVKQGWEAWGSGKVAECCYRTAMEDVTGVAAIAQWFGA